MYGVIIINFILIFFFLEWSAIMHSTCESFSERVSELTHPELPIYSFEL